MFDMDIIPFLKLMVEKNASDIFFTAGAPASLKINGNITPLGSVKLTSTQLQEIANALMSESQRKDFTRDLELNIALSVENTGRFRVNIFKQRGSVGLVIRYLVSEIPSIESLNLPKILQDIILEKRGLVLVVGATGSGKSTALASMIDYRNENSRGHILTIEDPIEFLHNHKESIVDQREVGIDTHSFENALKNALREAPDIILIGEVRDPNIMKHALSYAETGHLCLTTLHANNSYQALERVINFFPKTVSKQILQDLSINLRAIISLRLIPDNFGKHTPAVEILLNTPYISDLIYKGEFSAIKEVMEKDKDMCSFDQALYELYKDEKITKDVALLYADSKNNLALKIKLSEKEPTSNTGQKFKIQKTDE